jgi:hypothetical protein
VAGFPEPLLLEERAALSVTRRRSREMALRLSAATKPRRVMGPCPLFCLGGGAEPFAVNAEYLE